MAPPTKVAEAQKSSKKRLDNFKHKDLMNKQKQIVNLESSSHSLRSASAHNKSKTLSLDEQEQLLRQEKEKHERLIGQLKAAEARNRTRLLKMRYVNLKEDEIEHLVDSQPSALKATRLEAFLPNPKAKKPEVYNPLNQIQRRRLEAILDGSAMIDRMLN